MLPLKTISGFLLKALIVYAALMAAWPYAATPYRAGFRAVSNTLFSSLSGRGGVRFEAYEAGAQHQDTQLVLQKFRPFVSARTEIASGLLGYRPTVFLITLVLATPVPWSRRWRAMLIGLLVVTIFVIFRVWLRILDAFSDGNVLSIYDLGAFWKSVLQGMVTILVRAPVPSYIVPAFIWLLVTFRRDDLQNLLDPAPTASRSTGDRSKHKSENAAGKKSR